MTRGQTLLGVDPGLRRTGYGVIRCDGAQLAHLAHGVITAPTAAPLPERLAALFDALTALITKYAPDAIAVEQVFVNTNAQATLLLGQARGALLAAATRSGAPVAEYTALQVKQAVVGYGKAQKVQVQEMVRRLLALAEPPPPDAADALACAICHAHQSRHPLAAAALANVSGVTRRKGRLRWDAAALAQLSRNGEQR
ncbi:crossover junction endodeoxyribonuclease RuvC [Hydrogenophilus thermoluteolus]|uniref:Crossover junction endodeoxyribonuclease RuvC n=1 Tax=Hydrogenophilus thermoluteolus TaxID=297 RepID=A0A2Z6DWM6_HYDTE|nr:crossover junction endodeoxyribonuclease RuvC [Hydrogenophilus thermoluteolus]BBD76795.1 crossover junction endodeoxyribonuclease RuvC [Hydrogenophilus thermoluteolus]